MIRRELSTLRSNLIGQGKRLTPTLLLIFLPALLLLFAVAVVSTRSGISLSSFMSDPSSVADISPFFGLLSNAGVLAWCAAVTICLFSAAVLRRGDGNRRVASFLRYFGLVTLLLLLDDLFLIHEQVETLGLSEKYLLLVYGALLAFGFVRYRLTIFKTDFLLLLLALGFFGLSVFVDAFQFELERLIGGVRILLEDGFKFLGIVAWLAYFARCGYGAFAALKDTSVQAGPALHE